VQVKRGRTTISTRRTRLAAACTFRSSVTFRRRPHGRLRFTARFFGNRAVYSAIARAR
jgi:hypothetical protein